MGDLNEDNRIVISPDTIKAQSSIKPEILPRQPQKTTRLLRSSRLFLHLCIRGPEKPFHESQLVRRICCILAGQFFQCLSFRLWNEKRREYPTQHKEGEYLHGRVRGASGN